MFKKAWLVRTRYAEDDVGDWEIRFTEPQVSYYLPKDIKEIVYAEIDAD